MVDKAVLRDRLSTFTSSFASLASKFFPHSEHDQYSTLPAFLQVASASAWCVSLCPEAAIVTVSKGSSPCASAKNLPHTEQLQYSFVPSFVQVAAANVPEIIADHRHGTELPRLVAAGQRPCLRDAQRHTGKRQAYRQQKRQRGDPKSSCLLHDLPSIFCAERRSENVHFFARKVLTNFSKRVYNVIDNLAEECFDLSFFCFSVKVCFFGKIFYFFRRLRSPNTATGCNVRLHPARRTPPPRPPSHRFILLHICARLLIPPARPARPPLMPSALRGGV